MGASAAAACGANKPDVYTNENIHFAVVWMEYGRSIISFHSFR
jgi:hypothetical protein